MVYNTQRYWVFGLCFSLLFRNYPDDGQSPKTQYLSETKSVHVNFTNRKVGSFQVMMNGNQIPYANMAKYLGMTLDAKSI
jgi:hypothetical protein